MVFLENLKSQLESFRPKIKELHDVFDIENSKERILELQEKAAEPGFWDDPEKSQPVLKETRTLEGHIEKYEKITSAFDDIEVMIEMAAEEEDSEEIVAEIEQEIEKLGDIPCRGGSCVVDPFGHYVTQPVWDKEDIIYADLDMQQAIASRMEFDGVGHYARPDVLELRVHE